MVGAPDPKAVRSVFSSGRLQSMEFWALLVDNTVLLKEWVHSAGPFTVLYLAKPVDVTTSRSVVRRRMAWVMKGVPSPVPMLFTEDGRGYWSAGWVRTYTRAEVSGVVPPPAGSGSEVTAAPQAATDTSARTNECLRVLSSCVAGKVDDFRRVATWARRAPGIARKTPTQALLFACSLESARQYATQQGATKEAEVMDCFGGTGRDVVACILAGRGYGA